VVRVSGASAASAGATFKNAAGADAVRFNAVNEGVWGNAISVTTFDGRSGLLAFSMAVTGSGPDRETFTNLSVDRDSQRYFVRMLSEGDDRTAPSRWITAENLAAGRAPELAVPVNGRATLAGGMDGLATLTRQDFLGLSDRRPDGGLRALERVDEVAIVCLPDIHIRPLPPPLRVPPEPPAPRDPCLPGTAPPVDATPAPAAATELPPRFSEGDIEAVQRALIEHCESRRDRVAILDMPLRASGGTRSVAESLEWRERLDSDRGFAGLYHPWVKVLDPLRPGQQPVREVPPCGHLAGVYARTDVTFGVHRAPANAELLWAEDVTAPIDDDLQAVLNPRGVNCLRAFPGRGIRVYGARTVSSDPAWRFVSTRRLLLMIEEAIDESTQWSVFEPHDHRLRLALRRSVSGFLEGLWRRGALAGATPQEAFYVKCDDTTNPPSAVDQGRLLAEVGVAPSVPAEFIVLRVGRTAEEIEVVER
jgi:hypothetical protein